MLHSFQILCDFDGTIALDDVTDALLEALAAPGWEELEQDWREGRIGSRCCMTRQVGLLQGDWADLDRVIDAIPVDPHFASFAAACARLDVPLIILSDGLDYPIRRILAREGLDLPVRANRLRRGTGGTWVLDTPHAAPGCIADAAHCKCRSLGGRRLGNTGLGTSGLPGGGLGSIVVGDGRSDACVAAHADFVFAKALPEGPSPLLKTCRESGLPHQAFTTFADVTAGLPALLRPASTGGALHTRESQLHG